MPEADYPPVHSSRKKANEPNCLVGAMMPRAD